MSNFIRHDIGLLKELIYYFYYFKSNTYSWKNIIAQNNNS